MEARPSGRKRISLGHEKWEAYGIATTIEFNVNILKPNFQMLKKYYIQDFKSILAFYYLK